MVDGPPRALLLRPVRPGEKRSTPPLAGLSPASARFEFSKKFAAILTQRSPSDGEEEEEEEVKEVRENEMPFQREETTDGAELFFKPPQAPKLNLGRPGLLTRPLTVECEQKDSPPLDQPAILPPAPLATSSLLDWSALDSDPLLEPDEELPEGSGDPIITDLSFNLQGEASKTARVQSPRQDRRAAAITPTTTAATNTFIKRSEVEKGTNYLLLIPLPANRLRVRLVVEGCRAMVLSVETGLVELEHDLPLCISLLDEKIGTFQQRFSQSSVFDHP